MSPFNSHVSFVTNTIEIYILGCQLLEDLVLNITIITTQDYTGLFTLLDDESDHHNGLRTIARETEGERGFSLHFTTR